MAGVLINIAPNLFYIIENGRNPAVAQRSAMETEIYGLKIVQFLLPRKDHRLPLLADVAKNYADTFPLVNENLSASFGFVGSFGFLLLVYVALTPRRTEAGSAHASRQLAFIAVALVMIATVGGFSSLFAQFVSPLIRAWNRVSIFIAFMSLTAMALAFDSIFARRWRPAPTFVAATLVALFGVWDQTASVDLARLKARREEFRADQDFMSNLEKHLAAGSAIYQLPYMTFPESPPVQSLGSYDMAKGYLHADNLRWSFGATAGRRGDDVFEGLSHLPISTQIELLNYMGFQGIYVDRRGYADHGIDLDAEIRKATGEVPMLQPGVGLAFYPLPRRDKHVHLSPEAEKARKTLGIVREGGKLTFDGTSPFDIDFTRSVATQFRSSSGLYKAESWGSWTMGSTVTVRLKEQLPRDFVLQLTARGFGPNLGAPATVTVDDVTRSFVPGPQFQRFDLPFSTNESTDTIVITVPHPAVPKDLGINADTRLLGLGLLDLKVVAQH
ncbi:hypothetical protein VAR608DRAFT_3479 [Variovorax sp. HW608]|uniref:DUF7024 domain-containing protein n=1 Tax=Variovorax sp. HW608 TaxID=1034889 RepID=UPI00081F9147|nr:hypothetical protein [Variovorax sp. HW608]SCK37652.1 hypothetical protein VAR608DRAFT_3479 [Variovorax sp. HW608]